MQDINFQRSYYWLLIVGVKRFAKSLWKSFKVDFAEIEERLSAAREEVSEEITLASEQAAHEFRRLQMIENREDQMFRIEQANELEENRCFRSQQSMALVETRDRRIQKLVKEEGNML